MRLVRLGALVGSVILLVATTVSMVNKRSELRSEANARVIAAVLVADQSVESTAMRALAVADVANNQTDPLDLVRSFPNGVSACVAAPTAQTCTDVDLLASSAFGSGAAASVVAGGPVIVTDNETESLLAVARGDVTAVIRLPVATLIDQRATSAIGEYDADVAIELSTSASADARTGPTVVDGRRVVTDTLTLPGAGGSIAVAASIPDDAGLVGDSLGLYLALLALGTVLMALAGWTFLLDRRSLERRATTDELTGLVNRREIERVADESLLAADRFNTGACVMLIDLNGFKQINDTLGHQFGDLVLQAAAERLVSAVRDTDVVARWGGDEFVILLPGIEDGRGVRASAERIGQMLGGTPIVGDVTITAAIGAALFPRHGATLDELIRAADVAMYGAKSTGVTHRLADSLAVEMATDELNASYGGPDRRRQRTDENDAVSRD